MGEVYRARDTRLNREVALKFAGESDPALATTLSLAEARAAAALSHPHLCTLFELDHCNGEAFIVMELIEGRTLASIIGTGRLRETSVLRYGAQIASGVAHAHERQIVHRDLKAGNVMIAVDDRAKVLDFGIARPLDAAGVREATTVAGPIDGGGALAGTLPYLAPELLRGEPPSPRSDVWALGILLYEMATGRRPFTGRTGVELTSAILTSPVPVMLENTSFGLRSIVQRCLEKEPGARYADAGQVAAALQALDSSQPATSSSRPRLSRRVLFAVAGAALVLAALATLIWRGRRAAPMPEAPIRSLAVLPLTSVSGSEGEDYFVDGITDALIGEIGQLESLSVISRTSSMRYKGTRQSIPEIARELNVDAVLEGSVARAGSRVRVTAQLVRAGTSLSMWTNTVDRDIGDIIALQRELARTVAGALATRLTPRQEARLASESRTAPAAVEAYLKGRSEWHKRTPSSLLAAIGLFEEAIRHDSAYAAAHAGLAWCYVLLGGFAIGETLSSESLPKARTAAARALALDADLAEGHAVMGYTLLYLWDLSGSEAGFRRALQLNPSDATGHFWYGARLAAAGRFDEAIAQAERAWELDPKSPIIAAGVSWMNHFARRHNRALEMATAALAIDRDFPVGLLRLTVARKHLNDVQAVAEGERAARASDDGPDYLAQLGQIYALQGRAADALRILDRLDELSRTRYVPAYDRALVQAALGRDDDAFASLQRAIDERYGPLVFVGVDPDLDALRADPRMAAIIARVKRGSP
jgi:serine/threonine-protein kinase